MSANENTPITAPDLTEALGRAKALARDQVAAAWQIHLDRIREQLEAGWRESLDQIFEERFVAVEQLLSRSWVAAVGTSRAEEREQGAASARTQLIEQWNGLLRGLRSADSPEEWTQVLLQGAREYTPHVLLFRLQGQRLEGSDGLRVPLEAAPAFGQCVETKDTMVAANTAEELSSEIAGLLSGERVYLFPIGKKATAVLLAQEPANVAALELLTAAAGGSGDGSKPLVLTGIGPATTSPRSSWVDLPKAEQEMHLRAQRFARTEVAQMVLHKVEQVHGGRASKSLYEALQADVDAARETYRSEYLANCPSMVDYLHLELVRTLGKGEADALGASYPGPLL